MEYDLVIRCDHFVDPGSFTFERNRALCIRNGQVIDVVDRDQSVAARCERDFKSSLVLPAFVNAHVHLDLSHMRDQDLDGADFEQWLIAVVQGRSAPVEEVAQAAGRAAREMVESGTSHVVDILADHAATFEVAQAVASTSIAGVLACESFDGLGPLDADQAFEQLKQRAEKVRQGIASSRLGVGYSPHAPYTTSQRLYHHCADDADERRMVQTTHLSESPMERDFIERGSGELRQLFEKFGVDFSAHKAFGGSPLDYWCQAVGEHGRDTLLVHCYDLTEGEIARLGAFAASVVYCPRSRTYFGHPAFELKNFLAAGCNVCLGTDSLASNQSVELFDELGRMREEQPDADAQTLFRIATTNGRRALARVHRERTNDVERWADLNVVEWAHESPSLDGVIEAKPRTLATVIEGELVFERKA